MKIHFLILVLCFDSIFSSVLEENNGYQKDFLTIYKNVFGNLPSPTNPPLGPQKFLEELAKNFHLKLIKPTTSFPPQASITNENVEEYKKCAKSVLKILHELIFSQTKFYKLQEPQTILVFIGENLNVALQLGLFDEDSGYLFDIAVRIAELCDAVDANKVLALLFGYKKEMKNPLPEELIKRIDIGHLNEVPLMREGVTKYLVRSFRENIALYLFGTMDGPVLKENAYATVLSKFPQPNSSEGDNNRLPNLLKGPDKDDSVVMEKILKGVTMLQLSKDLTNKVNEFFKVINEKSDLNLKETTMNYFKGVDPFNMEMKDIEEYVKEDMKEKLKSALILPRVPPKQIEKPLENFKGMLEGYEEIEELLTDGDIDLITSRFNNKSSEEIVTKSLKAANSVMESLVSCGSSNVNDMKFRRFMIALTVEIFPNIDVVPLKISPKSASEKVWKKFFKYCFEKKKCYVFDGFALHRMIEHYRYNNDNKPLFLGYAKMMPQFLRRLVKNLDIPDLKTFEIDQETFDNDKCSQFLNSFPGKHIYIGRLKHRILSKCRDKFRELCEAYISKNKGIKINEAFDIVFSKALELNTPLNAEICSFLVDAVHGKKGSDLLYYLNLKKYIIDRQSVNLENFNSNRL